MRQQRIRQDADDRRTAHEEEIKRQYDQKVSEKQFEIQVASTRNRPLTKL